MGDLYPPLRGGSQTTQAAEALSVAYVIDWLKVARHLHLEGNHDAANLMIAIALV